MKYFLYILLISINLSLPQKLISQFNLRDTTPINGITKYIKIGKSNSLAFNKTNSLPFEYSRIKKKNIVFQNTASSFKRFFSKSSMLLEPSDNDNYKRMYFFDSCNIYLNKLYNLYEQESLFNIKSVTISNSYVVNKLHIEYINFEDINLYNVYTPELFINKSSGILNIDYVLFNKYIYISNFRGKIKSQMFGTVNDTLQMRIDESNVSITLFEISTKKYIDFNFYRDTLTDQVTIFGVNSNKTLCYFNECYINCPIIINGTSKNINYTFDNCKFGPKAAILQFQGNSIEFINCKEFELPVSIIRDQMPENKMPVFLTCINTDVRKLNFEYQGDFKIAESPLDAKENTISNYELLLEKYKSEGKSTSYKNLKIEFKQYQYLQNGFSGKLQNFIDQTWWGYGFDRNKIFKWIFYFISGFFLGNFFYRKKINEFYPIYGGENISYHLRNKITYRIGYAVRIFFITLIIFFALPIKLRELFKFNLSFISWIIFQYLVGVMCLFFVLNYVIKFNP